MVVILSLIGRDDVSHIGGVLLITEVVSQFFGSLVGKLHELGFELESNRLPCPSSVQKLKFCRNGQILCLDLKFCGLWKTGFFIYWF